ncbi:MAG: sulfite oxidase-like oxidoreductase [Chloroflexi bacterium]|nr:sulfite oxidase-like oxidoreductase [Chloroflexota bacterium]
MLGKLGRTQTIKQDQKGLEVPPGQFLTEKFPVLTFGSAPKVDLETWQFKISGLVEKEISLTWGEFMSLEKVTLDAEFHCVTQWSRLQNTWEGVSFNEVMKLLKLKPEAKYIMAHCYGGYSTNLALDVVTDDDVLFAYKHDGKLLSRDHGGPLRLVVPKRYAWKSAKWVNGLEFMAEDEPGFWEVRGYHMRGDPWKEERFQSGLY